MQILSSIELNSNLIRNWTFYDSQWCGGLILQNILHFYVRRECVWCGVILKSVMSTQHTRTQYGQMHIYYELGVSTDESQQWKCAKRLMMLHSIDEWLTGHGQSTTANGMTFHSQMAECTRGMLSSFQFASLIFAHRTHTHTHTIIAQ